jgi:hypothetical protein
MEACKFQWEEGGVVYAQTKKTICNEQTGGDLSELRDVFHRLVRRRRLQSRRTSLLLPGLRREERMHVRQGRTRDSMTDRLPIQLILESAADMLDENTILAESQEEQEYENWKYG